MACRGTGRVEERIPASDHAADIATFHGIFAELSPRLAAFRAVPGLR